MPRSAQSGTLAANTVATLTVVKAYPGVNIVNRGGALGLTGTIWVTVDGTTPTIGGANCYPVAASPGMRWFAVAAPQSAAVTVKLLSSAALDYTVEGDPEGV